MRGPPYVLACLVALWFVSSCCEANIIFSPPPLQDGKRIIASSVSCKGRLQGWQWNKCSIPDAVAWTSAAFGHANFSEYSYTKHPRTMGQHIQYSPLTCQQPYMGKFDLNDDLHLPPMVLAVYLESPLSQTLLWKSEMILSFVVEMYDNYLDLSLDLRRTSFTCDCEDPATYKNGSLSLATNTEYILDNVLTHLSKPVFAEYPGYPIGAECFLINVGAHISAEKADENSYIHRSVDWDFSFAVAIDRSAQLLPRKQKTQRRFHSNFVTHNLCPNMDFSSRPGQRYQSAMKTLSIEFENSFGKISLNVLSASVTHDRRQQAVVEFLVWYEENDECGDIGHNPHINCISSTFAFVDLSCSVHGIRVPATVERGKFSYFHYPRERVITCVFNSSSFSMHYATLDVHLDDSFMNFQAVVPVCALEHSRPIKKIVACSQPIFNAAFLEARWPGILQAWVLYHVMLPECGSHCMHPHTLIGRILGFRPLFILRRRRFISPLHSTSSEFNIFHILLQMGSYPLSAKRDDKFQQILH